jgi:adenosine kinase
MSALICGSLAYDTIMVFPDQFKNHILPDKVHILNVSFLVPRMRRDSAAAPATSPTTSSCSAATRSRWPPSARISVPTAILPGTRYHPGARQGDPELFTPQAFITTDLDNNQITAFHPGAMMRSYENQVKNVPGVTIGIVSPDGYEGMIQNATQFAEAGIPFIFDPGQAMPLFNGTELRAFIEQADYVTVNDYESNLLQERTGWSESEIAGKVKAYIATRGPKGAIIYADGKTWTCRLRTNAASPIRPAAATRSAPD